MSPRSRLMISWPSLRMCSPLRGWNNGERRRKTGVPLWSEAMSKLLIWAMNLTCKMVPTVSMVCFPGKGSSADVQPNEGNLKKKKCPRWILKSCTFRLELLAFSSKLQNAELILKLKLSKDLCDEERLIKSVLVNLHCSVLAQFCLIFELQDPF